MDTELDLLIAIREEGLAALSEMQAEMDGLSGTMESLGVAAADLDAQVAGFEASLSGAQAVASEAAAGADTLAASMADATAAAGSESAAFADLSANMQAFVAELSGLAFSAEGADAAIASTGETAAASLGAAADAATTAAASMGSVAETASAAAAGMSELGAAADGAASAQSAAAASLEASGAAAATAAAGDQAVAAAAAEAAAAEEGLSASALAATGSQAGLAAMTGDVGGAMTVLGTSSLAATAGIGAVALGLGEVGKQTIDFNKNLMDVANNTNMSTAQMDQMRQTVLKLGDQSGQSFDLLSQGLMHSFDITQNMSAASAELTVANEAAVASGGNVADYTNILSNAMHEYKADVSDATTAQGQFSQVQQNAAQYMGIFHLAASESNMTMEQFADNSGKAVGIAANLGIPIQQVAAALAALTLHGYHAAQAQTQLVNVMTHMIAPSKLQEAALADLSQQTGVDLVNDFTAAGLNAKGLTSVMDDLTSAYEKTGLTQAEAEGETMKLMAAMRGGLGMASLLGTAAGDYNRILGDLNNTTLTGSITQDQYNRTMQTTAQQLDVLKNNFETFGLALGGAIIPTAVKDMNDLATAVKGVGTALDTLKRGASDLGSLLPGGKLGGSQGFMAGVTQELQNRNPFQQLFDEFGQFHTHVQQAQLDVHALGDGFDYVRAQVDSTYRSQQQFDQDAQGVAAHMETFTMKLGDQSLAWVETTKSMDANVESTAQLNAQYAGFADHMQRLYDLNAGAANVIQQTTQAELAQITATNAVNTALDALHNTYESGLGAIQAFNAANGEYQTQASAIKDAVDAINQKKAQGIPLTQEETSLLNDQAPLLARLNGAMSDNKEQAGFAAAANVNLMKAQDTLNGLLRQGISSGANYDAAMKNVQTATQNAKQYGLDPAQNGASALNQGLASLQGVISSTLVPAIHDLTTAITGVPTSHDTKITADTAAAQQHIAQVNQDIDGIPTGHVTTPTVEITIAQQHIQQVNQDIDGIPVGHDTAVTADISAAEQHLQQVNADIDAVPTSFTIYANVNTTDAEAAIAGLNSLLPHSPAEKGPFSVLPNWMALFDGIVPAADEAAAGLHQSLGGLSAMLPHSAAETGPLSKLPNWNALFDQLPAAADKYSKSAMSDLASNIDSVVNGTFATNLQRDVANLQFLIGEAVAHGAPADFVSQLQTQLASKQQELSAAGQLAGDAIAAGLATDPAIEQAGKDTASVIQKVLASPDSLTQYQDAAKQAAEAYQIALAEHLPADVIASLKTAADQAQSEATAAGKALADAEAKGFVQDPTLKAASAAAGKQAADVIAQVLSDPNALSKYQDAATQASEAYKLALIEHLPQDTIDSLAQAAAQAQQQAAEAGKALGDATAAGYVQATQNITDDQYAQIKTLVQQAKDGGVSMVDDIVTAVEDGRLSATNAMKLFTQPMLDQLKQVEQDWSVKYAQAVLTGDKAAQQAANNGLKAVNDMLAQQVGLLQQVNEGMDKIATGYITKAAQSATTAAGGASGSSAPSYQVDANGTVYTVDANGNKTVLSDISGIDLATYDQARNAQLLQAAQEAYAQQQQLRAFQTTGFQPGSGFNLPGGGPPPPTPMILGTSTPPAVPGQPVPITVQVYISPTEVAGITDMHQLQQIKAVTIPGGVGA